MGAIRSCSRCGHTMVQVTEITDHERYYNCIHCGHIEYPGRSPLYIMTSDNTDDVEEKRK